MKYIAHQRQSDKTKQSLENHLSNVAQLAKDNASKIGLPKHGELIGLLHDLGKYSQQFQDYLNSAVGNIDPDADEYTNAKAMKGKIDHSSKVGCAEERSTSNYPSDALPIVSTSYELINKNYFL